MHVNAPDRLAVRQAHGRLLESQADDLVLPGGGPGGRRVRRAWPARRARPVRPARRDGAQPAASCGTAADGSLGCASREEALERLTHEVGLELERRAGAALRGRVAAQVPVREGHAAQRDPLWQPPSPL